MSFLLKLRTYAWIGLGSVAAACTLQMPKEEDVFLVDSGRSQIVPQSDAAESRQAARGDGEDLGTAGGGPSREAGDDETGSPTRPSREAGDDETGAAGGGPSFEDAHGGGGQGGSGGDPDDGLVAHFGFDETTSDVVTNLSDMARNGRYFGACTHPTGRIGGAVRIRNIDGTTSTTEWIELPTGLLSNLSATTISLWVRDLSTSRKGGRLIDFSRGGGETIYFSPDDENSATSVAGAHLGGRHDGSAFVDLWTTTPLTDKAWHQVVFTWNVAGIALYIDGRSMSRQPSPGVLPSDLGVTSPNFVGRTLNDAFIALYAEIDDLRIYDRALSAAEIAQAYRTQ